MFSCLHREVEVRRLPVLDANFRDVSRRYAAAVEVITEKEMQVRYLLSRCFCIFIMSTALIWYVHDINIFFLTLVHSAARAYVGSRGYARHTQGTDG
jgi:hypothetical protein